MFVQIQESWYRFLQEEFALPYFAKLGTFVRQAYQKGTVYPPGNKIFATFNKCPFEQVKVVILGQDPYHGVGQANGLAFAVGNNITIPPSLRNIFQEINNDLQKPVKTKSDLLDWSNQGVLLLNATLTVQAHLAGSHQNKGWEIFTDIVVKILNNERKHLVFMLWGAYAQKKGLIINKTKHLVLKAPHPSPFSANRGFFGCQHFSRANKYLKAHNQEIIQW